MLKLLTVHVVLSYIPSNVVILKWTFIERDSRTMDMNFVVHLILFVRTVGVLFLPTFVKSKVEYVCI
jgi:hypothetical protein